MRPANSRTQHAMRGQSALDHLLARELDLMRPAISRTQHAIRGQSALDHLLARELDLVEQQQVSALGLQLRRA